MHFKILVVFAFTLHIYWHLRKATNLNRFVCWNTISAVTWWTVHEHIVADVFRPKKRSSALPAHKQQAPQKWCPTITFVALAAYEQVALMSLSRGKIRLLLYIHGQFALSLHLLCSTTYIWCNYFVQTTVLLKVKDI